ncbi:MAG: NRDE family protein [Bacteroidota bacterium]
MCLIFLAYNQHPEYPLIIAANRDEFLNRPAKPLDYWDDNSNILAGRDKVAGGTWMGITRSGYFALLTNYRDPKNLKSNVPSRGKLVSGYLMGDFNPPSYLKALFASAANYNGYNIILGTLDDPWYFSSGDDRITRLGSGIYGLSNAFLDTKWPKVERGKEKFKQIISQDKISTDALLEMMQDKSLAEDKQLPDTGVGYEIEKQLSAMFIDMEGYGTRSTTILLNHKSGEVEMIERTHSSINQSGTDVKFVLSPQR